MGDNAGERAATDKRSWEIDVPPGSSALDVALAVLECMVTEHKAVVTEFDVLADGSRSFTVRIPRAATQ